MELENKVVVITGGASGIGAATGKALAAKGAKVVLADLNAEALQEVVDMINSSGGEAIGVKANVTKEEEVSMLMDAAVSKFGAINVVLPSAGIFKDAFFISPDRETGKVRKTMSTEQFMAVIEVNLLGTFLTLREAATRMIDNKWKGVLFTVSSINKEGQPGQLNYSSTKASVALWPKILGGEFHAKGIKDIRVVGIAPGYVRTPLLEGMKQEVLDSIVRDVSIGRLVDPQEIVDTIEFAVRNEAITGTTLEVSGGVMSKGLVK